MDSTRDYQQYGQLGAGRLGKTGEGPVGPRYLGDVRPQPAAHLAPSRAVLIHFLLIFGN